jgi:hypothetical protein
VNLPVFPDTLTNWMMSGSGSSLSDPWKAISIVFGAMEAGPEA